MSTNTPVTNAHVLKEITVAEGQRHALGVVGRKSGISNSPPMTRVGMSFTTVSHKDGSPTPEYP